MSDQIFNVLFLCTGISARSILAEAILNREGQGRFKGFSAGSHPKGDVHPHSLRLLKAMNHDTSRARSKSWSEFAAPEAPKMDFVFTVCDDAAKETCPVWPGQPMTSLDKLALQRRLDEIGRRLPGAGAEDHGVRPVATPGGGSARHGSPCSYHRGKGSWS